MVRLCTICIILLLTACVCIQSRTTNFPESYALNQTTDITTSGIEREALIVVGSFGDIWVASCYMYLSPCNADTVVKYSQSGEGGQIQQTDFSIDYMANSNDRTYLLDKVKKEVRCVHHNMSISNASWTLNDDVKKIEDIGDINGIAAYNSTLYVLTDKIFIFHIEEHAQQDGTEKFNLHFTTSIAPAHTFEDPMSIHVGVHGIYVHALDDRMEHTIFHLPPNEVKFVNWTVEAGSVVLNDQHNILLVANYKNNIFMYDATNGSKKGAVEVNVGHISSVAVSGDYLYTHSFGDTEVYQYCWQPPLSVDVTPVSCNGNSDGAAVVTSNLAVNYWAYANGTSIKEKEKEVKDLYAQNITLSVQADRGCPRVVIISIPQPAPLSVIYLNNSITCGSQQNAIPLLQGQGGSSPYNYTLIDPIRNVTFYGDQDGNFTSADTAEGLIPGDYKVVVTDSAQCVFTLEHLIYVHVLNVEDISRNITPTCFGQHTGQIKLLLPNSSYSYNWDGGVQYNATADNLPAGSYNVTITNEATGCVWKILGMKVANLEKLNVKLTVTALAGPNKNQGEITAVISGGLPPYTCELAGYGSVKEVQGFCQFANLSTGTMELTVRDARSCIEIASIELASGITYFGIPEGAVVGVAFGVAGFFILIMVVLGLLIRKGKIPAFFPRVYRNKYARVAPKHNVEVIPSKET